MNLGKDSESKEGIMYQNVRDADERAGIPWHSVQGHGHLKHC